MKNTMITNNTIRSDCQNMSFFCFIGAVAFSEKTKVWLLAAENGFFSIQ